MHFKIRHWERRRPRRQQLINESADEDVGAPIQNETQMLE